MHRPRGIAIAVLGGLLLVGTCVARGDDAPGLAKHGRQFIDGVGAYQAGDYRTAVEHFEALAAAGVRNGKLYYNLGNAYLRNGDLGRAVLWYERAALLLGTADPDLRFNREYVRKLVTDQEPESGVEWGRVLLFWRGRVSRSVLVAGSVISNACLWLLLVGARLWHRRSLRRWAVVCAGVLSLLLLTLGYDGWATGRDGEGVILPAEVAVRSATNADATELFRLHAGSVVRVDRQQNGYVRVRFGADAIGWLPQEDVGRIRAAIFGEGS